MMSRYFNRPLALLPSEAALILRTLQSEDLGRLAQLGGDVAPDITRRPYDLIGGIAVIEIRGILVHGDCDWWFGEMSYGRIADNFRLAALDTEVRGIALHVDSPGGEVSGCDALAEEIFAARGAKPIRAIVDENAYSAGYWLASAADQISVTRTGGTGSIGVVGMHLDITKALDQIGFKVTTVQFGARKTDRYPTTPMSDAALARFQDDIDTIGAMFVDAVARNRGLPASQVKDTEAATFLGARGVEAGLADVIATPDEAFAAFIAELA